MEPSRPVPQVDCRVHQVVDELVKVKDELVKVKSDCQCLVERVDRALITLEEVGSAQAPRVPINPVSIIDLVASYYRLTAAEIRGPSRARVYVKARHVAIYLMRYKLGFSFPQLARAVGRSDHTSAMHAYRQMEKQLAGNKELRRQVNELLQYFG